MTRIDPVEWVRGNARGHSVSWIRDRLGAASGREYAFDEVRAVCMEAGVRPVRVGGHRHDFNGGRADGREA